MTNGRTLLRSVFAAVGGIGALAALAGMVPGVVMAVGITLVFLGGTDFGRQCPLFLSVQHQLARWKKRRAVVTPFEHPSGE